MTLAGGNRSLGPGGSNEREGLPCPRYGTKGPWCMGTALSRVSEVTTSGGNRDGALPWQPCFPCDRDGHRQSSGYFLRWPIILTTPLPHTGKPVYPDFFGTSEASASLFVLFIPSPSSQKIKMMSPARGTSRVTRTTVTKYHPRLSLRFAHPSGLHEHQHISPGLPLFWPSGEVPPSPSQEELPVLDGHYYDLERDRAPLPALSPLGLRLSAFTASRFQSGSVTRQAHHHALTVRAEPG